MKEMICNKTHGGRSLIIFLGTAALALLMLVSIAGAAPYAYITEYSSNTISVIDTETNTVTVTLPVGSGPQGIAVTPDGAKVYVTNTRSGTVSVIDTSINTVSATVSVGNHPQAVAASLDGTKVYVTNLESGTVSVIDTATDTVTATVPVGGQPKGVAVTPDGTKVYVANCAGLYVGSGFSISVIDTATNTVSKVNVLDPIAVAISPDGRTAYVTTYRTMSVIDTETNTVTATLYVGEGTWGVAVSPDGTKVYVTSLYSNGVSVIDTATNSVTATVPVGPNPWGVAVTPDGTKVYVVNSMLTRTVSVIDTVTNTVTATIPVGNSPIGIAIRQFTDTTPATNTAPVADAGGPYQAYEGSPVTFDASSSSDPDGDVLKYRWDFESDGIWNTDWSIVPTVTHIWTDDWSGSATLEVSDGEYTSTDAATVTISNANPVVKAGDDKTVNEGDTVSFSGSYTDAGSADTHTISWDFGDGSTSNMLTPTHVYADNEVYTATLTVTDNNGGVGTDTVTITVNNVNPSVGEMKAPIDPTSLKTPIITSCTFADVGLKDTHTGIWNWGDGTSSEGAVIEANGAGTITGQHPYAEAGVYLVTLTVTDDDGGSSSVTTQDYVVIYNPEGGFVTGGGWIYSPENAYVENPELVGKATFGFVSKYEKGATVPTGKTEFQFKVADLNFKSTSYDWLVIAGSKAKYKGTGTINGGGNYGFMLSAFDGVNGDGIDKFRIKIWDKDNGDTVIYDNEIDSGINTEEDVEPSTAIGGGSIVVHKE